MTKVLCVPFILIYILKQLVDSFNVVIAAPPLARKLYEEAEAKGRKLSNIAIRSMYFIVISLTTIELSTAVYNMAIGNMNVSTWSELFSIE